MKKFLTTVIAFVLMVSPALGATTLWEFYEYELPSVSERVHTAANCGIYDYVGSYEQNTLLLACLEEKELGANPFQPSGISVNIREDLVSGSARTQTTLIVDPLITGGHRVVMSDFGSTTKAFAKLDQGTSNEEIMSFTGITDNTSTYTLTGVDWGYNTYNSATSTSNRKRHFAGSSFIITNDWHFINENYISKNGDPTFAVLPTVPETTPVATNEVASWGVISGLVNQGAATSTESLGGISELATQLQMASSTNLGADNPLVLQAKYATSTPTIDGLYVPVSENDGYLNQGWIDTSEDFIFTGSTTLASTTISGTATTTVQSPIVLQDNVYGAFTRWDVYTSDDTWTKPEGVKFVKVIVVGGGGGPDDISAANASCAGGGGGGTAIEIIDVSATTSVAVTVGTGGSDNAAGGNSDFGQYLYGNGGAGAACKSTSGIQTGGSGGTATGGDLNMPGQNGGWALYGDAYITGHGGDSFMGVGGVARISNAGLSTGGGYGGSGYGAGGSGAMANSGSDTSGDGADGVVIVMY